MESKCDILFKLVKQAFEETMQEVLCEDVISGEAFTIEHKDNLSTSIIIGLSGKANGRILFNMSYECAKNLAVAMNFGKSLETEDDLHIYLSEIASIFYSIAMNYFNETFGERELWFSPAAIFSAQNLDIVTPHVSSIYAYYKSSLGDFILDIGLSEDTYDEF